MSSWMTYLSDRDKAIGEVAGIESEIINIHIYPEYFDKVGFGSILMINSINIKPIGIVIKIAHSSRYQTFTPIRMTRDEIKKTYPDLDLYHLFVSSIIYTSHIDPYNKIKHFRANAPRLHDLVYLIDNEELLEKFFKPENEWDFNFLGYFFNNGGNILVFRDFLFRHRDFFIKKSSEKKKIIESLISVMKKYGIDIINDLLIQLTDVLGW